MAQNSSRSSSVSSSSGGETDCRYKRIKLDPSELDGSPSSTEATLTQPTLPANMKTQAAFVNKLYKMLEDPDTSELISWSSHGDLFSVSNPTSFSKTVLPQYFKHNNWQSFVRQLNMYGFHKVNDLIHSNLTNENQTWEFKHPNFRKGAVGDLQHIKRKSAKTQLQASPQFNFNSNESSYTSSKADEQQQQQQQQQQQNQQQNQQQQNQNQQQQNQNQQQQNQNQQQQNQNQHQYQQQQQHQQHQQDMSNGDNNNNSPVIKHILRIEEHLLGVTKSCESLFNEVVHLRMVVSKQQDAMQDLVDVVSSTKSNNNCICSNNNNPNHSMYNDNNNQELQNAENLRIQVSKLKESRQSRKSPSADSQSSGSMKNGTSTNATTTTTTTTNWSQTTTASPSINNNNNNNHNNNNNNNNEKPNDTKQRKLPSFDSIRQQQRQSSYRLDATREDDKPSFDRKSSTCSSSSSSSSVVVPKYTNIDDSKNRSTMMGFGKQSHMLNPIHEQNRRKS